jgi:hypothetical protein
MESHVKILGVLFVIRGIMHIMIGGIVTILLAGGGLAAGISPLTAFLMTIAVVISIVAIIIAIPEIMAGWGLLLRKRWARILGIVVGALEIFHVPLGTALGIYAFWVLFNSESEKLLTR